jgi:exodeoxyribonuclease III
MRIATWNVNSLRVRLPHVLTWLATYQPDVLALQELKLPTDDFPTAELLKAGYHAVVLGQRTYNGVALLARSDQLTECQFGLPHFQDEQARVLSATYQDVRIINVYVPNGESLDSEKYQYKMRWGAALTEHLAAEIRKHAKLIVLGDFNIAPSDLDVHDPKRWQGKVLCSDKERALFQGFLSLGLIDCFRHLYPDKKAYSWWDYRLEAYKRKWGLRIDHLLTTKPLQQTCDECWIDEMPRAWDRPSDHAPVLATFSAQ